MLDALADDNQATLPAENAPLPEHGLQRPSRWARLLGRARLHEAEQRLAQARVAFAARLTDLPDAQALRTLVQTCPSLAELWHLRPEAYRRLALHHSQAEAERRLAPLDAHFAQPPR